jgi:hypothetical protein
MYLPEDKTYTLTTSSGAASQTITNIKNKRISRIYVNPATASTEYDITITDKNSAVVYSQTDVVGKFIDYPQEFVTGNITFALANASADEAFSVIVQFLEEAY